MERRENDNDNEQGDGQTTRQDTTTVINQFNHSKFCVTVTTITYVTEGLVRNFRFDGKPLNVDIHIAQGVGRSANRLFYRFRHCIDFARVARTDRYPKQSPTVICGNATYTTRSRFIHLIRHDYDDLSYYCTVSNNGVDAMRKCIILFYVYR